MTFVGGNSTPLNKEAQTNFDGLVNVVSKTEAVPKPVAAKPAASKPATNAEQTDALKAAIVSLNKLKAELAGQKAINEELQEDNTNLTINNVELSQEKVHLTQENGELKKKDDELSA